MFLSGDFASDNTKLGKYCGHTGNDQPLESRGEVMTVTFHTDDSMNGTGFSAEYKTGSVKGKYTDNLITHLFTHVYSHAHTHVCECIYIYIYI